jgi:hypothetical protein
MEQPGLQGERRFSNPQEELEYLRMQIAQKERLLEEQGYTPERAQVASETIRSYASLPKQEVLADTHALSEREVGEIVLDIEPDEHDEAIADLLGVVQEKGIRNAISVVQELGNAHIEDDFHRVLVQMVTQGYVSGLKEREPLWNLLHMTLFEVALPERSKEEPERPFKELVSSMEQWYAGMISSDESLESQSHFTIEFAVSHDRQELVMYVAVPNSRKDLFEKHVLSFFPKAIVRAQRNDYNIFVEGGVHKLATAHFDHDGLLPLKQYDEFDFDPLTALINAFSKLSAEGEGAAVQCVISPYGEKYHHRGKRVIEKLRDGKRLREALREVPDTLGGEILQTFRMFAKTAMQSASDQAKEKEKLRERDLQRTDDVAMEMINKKIATPIAAVNLRVVVSALSQPRADELLADLKSCFNQFENPNGNRIGWTVATGRGLTAATKRFSFREFARDEFMPVSVRELTSMIHFPLGLTASPHLKITHASPSQRTTRAW